MKVPIDDRHCIDLSAPVLPTYATNLNGVQRYAVWYNHCRVWHFHGPAEGHREAHCSMPDSPYIATGYNLALRAKASREQLRQLGESRERSS